MKSQANAGLAAITCYYNPFRNGHRREGYRHFRQHLDIPLLCVELSCDGEFELHDSDAEWLVRVRGTDVVWQKERLLNIGLEHVPRKFSMIAWLDCDLLFLNPAWAVDTCELLGRYPIVQAFHDLYERRSDSRSELALADADYVVSSIASAVGSESFPVLC